MQVLLHDVKLCRLGKYKSFWDFFLFNWEKNILFGFGNDSRKGSRFYSGKNHCRNLSYLNPGISRTLDPASRDEENWVRTHGFGKRRVPGRKVFFAVKRPNILIFYLGFVVYLGAACPIAS